MLPLETLFSQGTIVRLGWMLVHFLWQATAVALLLAALLRLLRRATANLRYAVACGALALMVVLPLLTMQLVEVPGPAAEVGPPPAIRQPLAVEPAVQEVEELPPLPPMSSLEAADLTTPMPWQERVIAALEPALPYLVLGWLAGVFGLSAWHLGGWTQLHQLKRRMTCGTDASLHATLDELVARLGMHRGVTLLESALVEVPTVIGWLQPVILLPASALTGLSPDQLRAILAHELAHIRRYDYLANILQTVIEILGFYHPAVWWISTRIRAERENCCDDLAVQVCGDSLQYARALTSLEEIRHSRGDLALAASGGSLMARVARLLGRPAVDDRRFAWLPGLIALLLVAGVIIPAALAFATPVPTESGDAGQTRDPSTVKATPLTQAGQEQDSAHVLIKFALFPEASARKVVDRETRNLLAGVLATEDLKALRETIHADPQQDVTLGEVLRSWVAGRPMTPEAMGMLIDVLQSRGYLDGESTPEVLAVNNQQARLNIGATELMVPPADPGSSPRQVQLGTFVQVTPHFSPSASDRIRLEVMAQWKERAKPDEPNSTPIIRETEIASTLTIPLGRCVALVTKGTSETDDRLHLLLIGPASIVAPPTTTEQASNASATTITEAPASDNTQRQGGAEILVESTIAKALADATLDRETILQIGDVLTDENPQIAGRLAADSDRGLTLSALLKTYLTGQALSPETSRALLDLLRTRGFVKILARPRVTTSDGDRAMVHLGYALPVPSSQQDGGPGTKTTTETIECGVSVDLTAHVEQNDDITLDLAVKAVEPVPQEQSSLPTIRTTEIVSAMTFPDHRSLWLLVEPGDDRDARTRDPESILVVLQPSIAKPAPAPAEQSTAQVRRGDKRPRHVLLEVRTVAAERSDLMNLGIEWAFPKVESSSGGSTPFEGVALGYAPDRRTTDALEAALAASPSRIQALSTRQVVGLDGRLSRVRAVTEEWLASDHPQSKTGFTRVDSGTILSFTPRVGDSNEITLEIESENSRTLPVGGGSDLPIVARRMAKNSVTVLNGGTVAIAGLTGNAGQSGQSARELAIFVTATILPETGRTTPAAPSSGR